MEFHRGRLIDHIHLVVADLDASKRFYTAALGALGRGLTGEGDGWFATDELFVSSRWEPWMRISCVHLAFQADGEEAVARFHRAAIEAGGRDNGAPGRRPRYHPNYYGAFVLDPDGNNIEAVWHGPHRRSAASVVLTAG